MDCPFLREANVRSCGAFASRKLILEAAASESERCATERYRECAASTAPAGAEPATRCPYLQESRAEYCAAAPVVRYIPASGGAASRCHSDGHFYCELFLSHADPEGARLPRHARAAAEATGIEFVGDVPVPTTLSYAPNHMWLDISPDGSRHAGIDGFLANVLGTVEKVTFAAPRGGDRAIAVLTVGGVDMQMVFPNPLYAVSANLYLRTAPEKITEDPYGAGWLFEAAEPPRNEWHDPIRDGLIDGPRAADWMRSETERLASFIHERVQRDDQGRVLAADGGLAAAGVASHLDRDDVIALYNEFFAPHCTLRRSA